MVLAYCLWDLVIIPFFGVVLQFLPFYLGYYLYYALFYLAAMVVLDKTVRMNLDMAYAVAFKILLISAIFLTVLQIAARAGLVALGVAQKVQEATTGQGTPGKPAAEDIPLYPDSLKADIALDLGPIKAFAYTVPNVTAEQVVTYFKEQMLAKGWTLRQAPPSGGTGYELAFVKVGRECSIAVMNESGGVKYMISEMQTQ
jgi:hypothetical protein